MPTRPSRRSGSATTVAFLTTHSTLGSQLAERIGLDDAVCVAISQAYEQREWPAGLTARKVEVLVLLARGRSNKAIAQLLVVSPQTVSNHVEHIYLRLGISGRAAATLFATQQGLMGSFEPAT